ncbi:unnamed protein product [Closterium sp. NIES-65]|nr:unnamed protein product [Closterium sp. NIES-65]
MCRAANFLSVPLPTFFLCPQAIHLCACTCGRAPMPHHQLHEDVRDMEPALPHLHRTPHCLVAAAARAAGAATCAPHTALSLGVPHSAAAPPLSSSPPWLAACQQHRDKHIPSLASSPYSPPSAALTLSRSLLDSTRVLPLSQAALSTLAALICPPTSAARDVGCGEADVVGGGSGGGEREWVEGRGSAGSSGEGSGDGAGGGGRRSSAAGGGSDGGGGGTRASSLWVAAVGLHCCRLLSRSSFTRCLHLPTFEASLAHAHPSTQQHDSTSLPPDLLPGGLLEKQSLLSAVTALASSPSITPTTSLDLPSLPLIRDLLSIFPRSPASLPLLSAMLRLATTSYTTVAEAAAAAAAAAAGAGGGATGGGEAAVSALSLPPASAVTFATRSRLDNDFDDDWEFQQPSAATSGLHGGRQGGHSGLQSAGGRGGRGGARGRLGRMMGSRSGAVVPIFQPQLQQQVIELEEEGGEGEETRIFDNELDAPGVLPSQAPLVRSRNTQSAWRDGAGGSGAAAGAARAAATTTAAGVLTGLSGGGGSATAAEVAEGAVWMVGWVAEFLPAAACREVVLLLELSEDSECYWQLLSVLASHAELLIALEPVLAALESHASTTLHSHQQHLLHLTTTTACRLAAHKDGALPPALLRDEGVGVLGGVERMEGVGSVVELADAWGGGADTATASDTDVNRALQVMQEALAPMLGSKPLPTPAARIHLADALLALILLSDSDLFTTPLLALLHDRDYGVRLHMAHLLPALFLKWEDHPALLTDTLGGGGGGRDEGKGGSGGEGGEEGGAGGSGETDEERVRREVERVDRARVETGVLLLGRIAESSDLVEDEVSYMPPLFSLHGVLTIIFALFASAAWWSCSACPSPLIQVIFLIAAAAALRLVRTNLAAAVLTTAAASLGYPSLSQYLDILLPSVATRWVAADPVLLPLPALAQVVVALEQAGGGRGMGGAGCWTAGGGGRQMLEEKGDHEAGGDTAWVVAAGVGGAGALARAWKRLAPLVLPALLLLGRESDVQFLAEALQAPAPRLLKESFPHVVAALLPFRQSELDTWQKEAATRVLTTGLLATAGWSEVERDQLLTKHMVPIITSLLQHTSSQQHPSLPSFPTACIRATICTLVDSTADSHASSNSISTSALPSAPPLVSDHLNILRPANVFPLLLALHKAAVAACSPRHRCHIIAALSVLVDILGNRVTVPPTFRYLVHILLACLPTSAPTWPPPAPPLASSQLSLSQSPSCPLPSPSTPAAVAAVCLDVLARVVAAAQSNGAREGGHSGMASAAVLDQSQIPPSPATLSAPPLPLSLQAIVSRLLALCTPPAAEAAVGAAAAGAGGGAIGVAEGGAAAGAAGQEGELPEALVELLRAFTVDAPAAVRARLQLLHMPAAAVAAHPSLACTHRSN